MVSKPVYKLTSFLMMKLKFLLFVLFTSLLSWGQISIPNTTPVTENFDSMSNSATATLPSNWKMSPKATAAPTWLLGTNYTVTAQQASSGSPTTGAVYNWGTTSGTDRSLGIMSSSSYGSPSSAMAYYRNTNTSTITQLDVSYRLERYRVNTAAASVQFYYSTDGSNWTAVTTGDVAAASLPTTATSAYDYTPGLTVSVSCSITGLSIAASSDVYLRWNMNTTGSNSQGIGIDDVSVTATFGSTTPGISTTGTPSALSTTYGTASTSTSFSVSGTSLTNDIIVTPPAGFEVSSAAGGPYTASLTLPQTGGTVAATGVYIRLKASDIPGTYSGNTVVTSVGAASVNVTMDPNNIVSQKVLTLSGVTANNKVYNANTLATVTGTPSLVGVINSDVVSLTGTGSWAFASPNVGTGVVVNVTGYSLTGAQASYYTLSTSSLTANITPVNLTVSGVTASNKVYDGTTVATISGGTLSGVLPADTANVSVSSAGTFASSNVGNNIVVTIGLTGSAAVNYTVTQPSLTANITIATQTITFGTLAPQTTSTADYNPGASASSGLTITYTSSDPSVATIVSNQIHIVGVGFTIITASQAGNGNYSAATAVTQTLFVMDCIAKWTFDGIAVSNSTSANTPSLTSGSVVADTGVQTTGSSFTAFHTNGSLWSTPSGNGSTYSLSANTWAANDYYQFVVNTSGYCNIALSYDQTGSNTGPKDFKLQYSIDGSSFTDFGATYSITNDSWLTSTFKPASVRNFDLSGISSVTNAATVYFRVVVVGSTSINGAVTAGGGTSRIDNFNVVGIRIPTPSFTTAPGVASCTNSNVTYTTQSGYYNYVWTVSGVLNTDYQIVSGGLGTTSNSVVIKWLTGGTKTVTVNYSNILGCTGTAATNTTTVSLPTIVTSGTVSAMCASGSAQNASMVYTSSTNSPTSYSIDWNAAANTAGLLDQSSTAYTFAAGGGTLSTIVVSANTAAGQYTGVMTVSNANLCTSTYTITIKIGKQWNGSDSTSPTDWNVANNWTPAGVPTASDCVVIPNGVPSPVVSGTNYIAYMNSINISNGNNLSVASGNTLVVTNVVTVASGGNLNISNNASLVQINNVTNVGNITYNRTANGIRGYDYVYWSSPVSGVSLNSIYSSPVSGDKYSWNTLASNVNSPLSVGNWEVATGTMGRGVGYIVRGSSSFAMPATNISGVFTGVPNNGLINNVVVSRGNNTIASSVGNNGTMVTNLDDNWNLIGNPYPSAIKALDFLNANSNLQGFVNLWTHQQSPTINTNPFYGTFLSNYDLNDYIVYNGTGTQSGPTGFNGYIAAGQAFFVSMVDGTQTSDVVQFNNSMRSSAYSNSQFYKSANETEKHRIWLDLVDSNNNSDRTLIGYISGASVGYDRLFDANTNSANSRSIYSVLNNESLTIQGRSVPFEDTDKVSLGINILVAGDYSIAISAVDGLFEQNQPIYIEDKLLNITHDLRESPYSFSSNNGTFNDRFLLKYTNAELSNTTFGTSSNQVLMVTKEQQLQIKSSKALMSTITIYDLLGRVVVSKSNIEANEISFKSLPSQQVLIVKVQLENGEVESRKVIL